MVVVVQTLVCLHYRLALEKMGFLAQKRSLPQMLVFVEW